MSLIHFRFIPIFPVSKYVYLICQISNSALIKTVETRSGKINESSKKQTGRAATLAPMSHHPKLVFKLFASRRIRSDKYTQSGWGTCSEMGDETEAISDESEDELCFSDSDVPNYIEPIIRSSTPTEPSQQIAAGGRGSKLYAKRAQRMQNYTKSGMGKQSGLPTGTLQLIFTTAVDTL